MGDFTTLPPSSFFLFLFSFEKEIFVSFVFVLVGPAVLMPKGIRRRLQFSGSSRLPSKSREAGGYKALFFFTTLKPPGFCFCFLFSMGDSIILFERFLLNLIIIAVKSTKFNALYSDFYNKIAYNC
jgi:hypothetical protein